MHVPSAMAAGRSILAFFFSSRRRHTILQGDWSSDVCSSDLATPGDRVRREPVEPIGAEPDLTAVGGDEAADHVEERRLAGAVRSDETRDRALADGERAAGERFDAAEALDDAGDGEELGRGRFPRGPGSYKISGGFGVWRSPVAHLLWEQGAAGSNPATPTIFNLNPSASVCPFCARQHRLGWFSLQAKSATRPRVVSVRAAVRQSTP